MLGLALQKLKCLLSLLMIVLILSGGVSSQRREVDSLKNPIEIGREADVLAGGWNAETLQRSIRLYLEAARLWESAGEFTRSADCYREASVSYTTLGENPESLRVLKNALRLDQRGSDHAKKVKTLSMLAISHLRVGNIPEAVLFSNEASTISESTSDPESSANSAYALGLVTYEQGKYKQAIEYFTRASSIWKQSGNLEGQAKDLLELAYAYLSDDQFTNGLTTAEEAYMVSEELGSLRYKVFTQNAVAVMKSNLGRKHEALTMFLRSERNFPDGVSPLEKGVMYSHLSGIYYNFDDLKLAQYYRFKAYELYKKEGNPFAQIAALSRLGLYAFRLGDKQKGLDYFDAGFKLAQQINSKYYLSLLNQDIGLLFFGNDNGRALKHFQIALAKFKDQKIRTYAAFIEGKIGAIYLQKNELEAARRFLNSSLNVSNDTKNKFTVSDTLFQLAKLDKRANDSESALNLVRQSIEVAENISAEVFNSNLKTSYFSSIYDRYELYIRLLMLGRTKSNDDRMIRALQISERSRTRSLTENLILTETILNRDADVAVVQREKETRILLNARSDRLSGLLGSDGDREEINKIESEIAEIENQLEDIKSESKKKSPIYSAIKNPEPFDVADFQANVLDDNSVLLEFSLGNEESYLWAVSKTEVSSFVLPSREKVEARVDKFRMLLKGRSIVAGESMEDYQARTASAESEYVSEARALSNEILGPAATKIAGKRLIVVSDGKLQYFPLGSLPMPNTESNDPILLTNEVVYEPSASALKIFKSDSNVGTKPTKDLLVFADPVFSKDDDRLTGLNTSNTGLLSTIFGGLRSGESLTNLQRLPASNEEATSIAKVVGTGETTVRSGFAANRDSVLNSDITDYRILHFATHGLIDEKRPELSGILLSLYNQDGTAQDGGFIRLQDVYGLNLHTDLVVLSACDTGVGKEVRGEGVMSLNNAFLQSGAKTVVSSLWKVDDNATKNLMTDFYRGMASEGLTASAALRNAQLKMYADPQFRSPFYWASFTVQGDYQRLPQISHSYYGRVAYLIGSIAILVFGVYGFRKIRMRQRSAKISVSA